MAGMTFLRDRSPVTPKSTMPHGPAMRGRRRSCGSRSGFVYVIWVLARSGAGLARASSGSCEDFADDGEVAGAAHVQAQHRTTVLGEHLTVADRLGGQELLERERPVRHREVGLGLPGHLEVDPGRGSALVVLAGRV